MSPGTAGTLSTIGLSAGGIQWPAQILLTRGLAASRRAPGTRTWQPSSLYRRTVDSREESLCGKNSIQTGCLFNTSDMFIYLKILTGLAFRWCCSRTWYGRFPCPLLPVIFLFLFPPRPPLPHINVKKRGFVFNNKSVYFKQQFTTITNHNQVTTSD